MNGPGGYREAAVGQKRRFEIRALIAQRGWWLTLPTILALFLMLFAMSPTHLDIECLALSQTCQIDVERAFGAHHDLKLLDMRGVTNVRYVGAGKHERLEVTSSRGTEGLDNNFTAAGGGGHDLVLDVLKRFVATPTLDIRGSHGLDLLPFELLAVGLLACFGISLAIVGRIHIVAESDDAQVTLRVRRWPFPTRVFIFASEEVVGAEARHMVRPGSKGGEIRSSTIQFLLRSGAEDLFPRGLPDSVAIDEVGRKLDLFARFGQVEADPAEPTRASRDATARHLNK